MIVFVEKHRPLAPDHELPVIAGQRNQRWRIILTRIVDQRPGLGEVAIRLLPNFFKHRLSSRDPLEILVGRDGRRLPRHKDTRMRHIHAVVGQQILDRHAEGRAGHLEPQHRPISFGVLGNACTDLQQKRFRAIPSAMVVRSARHRQKGAVVYLDLRRLCQDAHRFNCDVHRFPQRSGKSGDAFQHDGLFHSEKHPADFLRARCRLLKAESPDQTVSNLLGQSSCRLPLPLPSRFPGPALQLQRVGRQRGSRAGELNRNSPQKPIFIPLQANAAGSALRRNQIRSVDRRKNFLVRGNILGRHFLDAAGLRSFHHFRIPGKHAAKRGDIDRRLGAILCSRRIAGQPGVGPIGAVRIDSIAGVVGD